MATRLSISLPKLSPLPKVEVAANIFFWLCYKRCNHKFNSASKFRQITLDFKESVVINCFGNNVSNV